MSQADARELNEIYRKLTDERDDLCGMTQLTFRTVATPFGGALAAALVVAEIVRLIRGGGIHAPLDLQTKNLRYSPGTPSLQ